MSGPDGALACEAFVEALGLKALFGVFMGKVNLCCFFRKQDCKLFSTKGFQEIEERHCTGF